MGNSESSGDSSCGVTKNERITYRWTYDREAQARHPKKLFFLAAGWFLFMMTIIFAVLLTISAALLIPLGLRFPPVSSSDIGSIIGGIIMIALYIYVGGMGVSYFMYFRSSYSYEMQGDNIRALGPWGSRYLHFPALSSVKIVRFLPEFDLIMFGRFLGNPIYVPSEDYLIVKDYILSHASDKIKIVNRD